MTAGTSLDRVLELVGQQRRSPAELRVLLALVDRELTLVELADRLGGQSSLEDVTETARRLATARLVRYRLSHERGETTLAITSSGLVTVRPLMSLDEFRPAPAQR